jgi:anti-anti-sigma factor
MVPFGPSYLTVPGRAPAPGAGFEADPIVVWLTGEHDISTDGALSQVLARAIALGATALVIDMSELGFMGASTLGTIVRARELLRRRSGTLTVRSAPPFARRIIDICGLNDLLGPEEAGTLAATALGLWVAVPAAGQPAPPSPSGLAPSRLPVRVRQTSAPRARAESTEGLAQSA